MDEQGITKVQALFRGHTVRTNVVLKTQQEFQEICQNVIQKVLVVTKDADQRRGETCIGNGMTSAEMFLDNLYAECMPSWCKDLTSKIATDGTKTKDNNLMCRFHTISKPFSGLTKNGETKIAEGKKSNGPKHQTSERTIKCSPADLRTSQHQTAERGVNTNRNGSLSSKICHSNSINRREKENIVLVAHKKGPQSISTSTNTSYLSPTHHSKCGKISSLMGNDYEAIKTSPPPSTICHENGLQKLHLRCANDNIPRRSYEEKEQCNQKSEVNSSHFEESNEKIPSAVEGDILERHEDLSLQQLETELHRVEQVLADRINYLQLIWGEKVPNVM